MFKAKCNRSVTHYTQNTIQHLKSKSSRANVKKTQQHKLRSAHPKLNFKSLLKFSTNYCLNLKSDLNSLDIFSTTYYEDKLTPYEMRVLLIFHQIKLWLGYAHHRAQTKLVCVRR